MKKSIDRICRKVAGGSAVVFALSALVVTVLIVYSLFAYPQAYFTTDPNFAPMSEVEPVLDGFIKTFLLILLSGGIVAYGSYLVAQIASRFAK